MIKDQLLQPDHIVALDKPVGMTSHDVVALVRRSTGIGKVGHAGTLDPLASGVLVVAIGRKATKKLTQLIGCDKEYVASIRLDGVSDTDDAEGRIRKIAPDKIPMRKQVETALGAFVGMIEQVPPVYSAVKIKGRPAYSYARKGQAVWLKARKVKIKRIELLLYDWPRMVIKVKCGPGVYIRALARDLGKRLGCGGYLVELVRTRVGEYTLERALSLLQIGEIAEKIKSE